MSAINTDISVLQRLLIPPPLPSSLTSAGKEQRCFLLNMAPMDH